MAKILLLSRYGKLLRRPIFLADNRVFVGFDEKNMLQIWILILVFIHGELFWRSVCQTVIGTVVRG